MSRLINPKNGFVWSGKGRRSLMKHFWYSLFLMICSLGTVSCSSLSWDELNFPSTEIKTVEETEEEYDYDSAEPSTELNLVQNGAS